MRILLVSPWARRHRRYKSPLNFLIAYPPLTLPTLAALVPPELEAEICVFDEISDRRLPAGRFDVVAITAMTTEAARAYELADLYRGQGSFVVLGGYHASFMPEEAAGHADAVVTGLADAAWPRLLRELAAGGWPAGIHDGGAELSGLAEGCPVPDRSVLKGRPYSPINTVIANHGCPNRCSFCAISRIADYRQRPIESVIDELRGLGRRNLIFYDPNFFADRAYALELMKAMEPLRLRWGATATVDFGFDDELLDAAQRAGLSGVLIGFESMSRQALESANKRFAEPGSYRQAVLNIHRRRITINGSFVLGLDEDSAEDLAILPDRILEMGIDLPLFFLLTPIPGSGLFEELKQQGRILTEDWSRYTQADVVFSPLGMTAGQLQDSYSLAWRRSYSFRNILRRVFNTPGTSAYHKFIVLCMNVGFKFLGRDRAVA